MENLIKTKRSIPPIGILDSGVGGLSVLNEICQRLPALQVHYVADSAWCPYGNKTQEAIQKRVFFLTEHLLKKGCGLIVIACNSATIAAIEALRSHYPIPFTGMEPAIKPAVKITNTGVIGVLATQASLTGEKFHKLLHSHGQGVRVITRACPRFVEFVERGELSGKKVEQAIKDYTAEMLEAKADTLVLGCTHYPFLRKKIEQVVGSNIKIIDTGEAVAKRTQQLLEQTYGTFTVADESTVQPAFSNALKQENALEKVQIETSGNLALLRSIFSTLCPDLKGTLSSI